MEKSVPGLNRLNSICSASPNRPDTKFIPESVQSLNVLSEELLDLGSLTERP